MKTTNDRSREGRLKHWQSYSPTKAARLDDIYQTSAMSTHLKTMMIEALSEVAAAHGGPGGTRVLDVGCGTGDVTRSLYDAGFHVDGIDVSKNMLAVFEARREGRNISAEVADIFTREPSLPLHQAALARCVFSHYDDFEELLSAISRQVADDGYIVFDSFGRDAVPYAATLLGLSEDDLNNKVFSGVASFSESQLSAACKRLGLTVVMRRSVSFFHRNPLLSQGYTDQAGYDAALAEYFAKEGVREFAAWFERNIARSLPTAMSAYLVTVVQKKKAPAANKAGMLARLSRFIVGET